MTTTPRSTGTRNAEDDPVSPSHYRNDSSGFECIELAEHFRSGLLQQAFQYVWRCDQKNGTEDLEKALWFIGREHQFRDKNRRAADQRSKAARALFLEWRVKVKSDLRAATLASLWRLDEDGSAHPTEFYTLSELVAALMEAKR